MSTNTISNANAIEYREDVLKELVLYVGAKCWRDEHYGVLKLNKILFYSDFHAFKVRGKPITGAEYKKYTHGPAPAVMKRVRKELETSEDAFEYKNPLPALNGDGEQYVEKRLLARRAANLDTFLTAEEIAIVDLWIEKLRPLTGTQVSRMSHDHPGWRYARMEDPIPYFTALLPDESDVLGGDDLAWAQKLADDYSAGTIAT
jgi:hypothetical protein